MSPQTVLACVIAPLLLQALSSSCPAATIAVPLQQPTIQAAIDIAEAGDTVLVSAGTYFENIDFKGKAITVKAAQGAQPAIIDGGSKAPVVTFHNGELATSVLTGFTIQHGMVLGGSPCNGDGGGVCILHASPTIRRNTIIDNYAYSGGGIAVQFGAPLIQDNTIANNKPMGSGGMGGGIYLNSTTTVRIVGNVIENNSIDFGGGIAMFSAGTPTVTGNILRGNWGSEGGGVWIVNYSNPYIADNLITANSSGSGAGIYWMVPQGWRGALVVNNTIADNVGQAVYADGFDTKARMIDNLVVAGGSQTALYCGVYDYTPPLLHDNDVYSAAGQAYENHCTSQTNHNGNISADPLFVAVSDKNYHLQALSPAIDSGTDTATKLAAGDFDGVPRILDGNIDGTAVVDMGAFEYRPDRAEGPDAATVPREPRKASRAGLVARPFRRYESVARGNHRDVQYYDAAGRRIAEVDARGVFHITH